MEKPLDAPEYLRPKTSPETLKKPRLEIVPAALGCLEKIRRVNFFNFRKVVLAFGIAAAIMMSNEPAAAVAPTVSPEPIINSSSFSIFVPPQEVVAPLVLTKVEAFEADTRTILNGYKDIFKIKEGDEKNLVHLITAIGQAESDLNPVVKGDGVGVMQIHEKAAQDVINRTGLEKGRKISEKDLKEDPVLSKKLAIGYTLMCREDIIKLTGITDPKILNELITLVYNAGRSDGLEMIRYTISYHGEITAQGVLRMTENNAEKIWEKLQIPKSKLNNLIKNNNRYRSFLRSF